MISTTQLQTKFGKFSLDDSAGNLALGLWTMNVEQKYLLQKYFSNEASYSIVTQANQQIYKLPADYSKLKTGTLTIGNLKWTPVEIYTRQEWDNLNVFPYYADIPSNFFIWQNQFQLWPIPSTTGNVISFNYKKRVPDLSLADYSTGTVTLPYSATFTTVIASGATSATLSGGFALATGSYQIVFSDGESRVVSLTNGSTAVTWTTGLTSSVTATITVNSATGGTIVIGSGTSFIPTVNTSNESRWIQFSPNTGDNLWYQVENVNSATQITMYGTYGGSAIAGGTYVLGQMPVLMEDFQDMLLWQALTYYFSSIVDNEGKKKEFQDKYDRKLTLLADYDGSKTVDVNLGRKAFRANPNIFPQSIG